MLSVAYAVGESGQPYQQPATVPPFQPAAPVPPQPAPQQQVVYRVVHTSFGETPVTTRCANCREDIRTRVSSSAGLGAWVAGFTLCFFGYA